MDEHKGGIQDASEHTNARLAGGGARTRCSHRAALLNMDSIRICDLEVFYRVGVPDEERAKPQRLLVTVEMESDFGPCAAADEISQTIDYFSVSQRLLMFGKGRS